MVVHLLCHRLQWWLRNEPSSRCDAGIGEALVHSRHCRIYFLHRKCRRFGAAHYVYLTEFLLGPQRGF